MLLAKFEVAILVTELKKTMTVGLRTKTSTRDLLIPPAALQPGVHSAYNRNEYQMQKNNVSGK
jgi:hypothetical protein